MCNPFDLQGRAPSVEFRFHLQNSKQNMRITVSMFPSVRMANRCKMRNTGCPNYVQVNPTICNLREARPSSKLVSFNVLIRLKMPGNRPNQCQQSDLHGRAQSLTKLIFREALWEPDLLVALMPCGCNCGSRAEVEWLWCPVRPLPPIPEFQRLTLTLDYNLKIEKSFLDEQID